MVFKYTLFGLKETTKPDDIAKNVYLRDEYRVCSELQDRVSAPFIRQEVEKMSASSKAFFKQFTTDIVVRTEDDLYRTLDIPRPTTPPKTVNPEPEPKPEIKEDKPAKETKQQPGKNEPKYEPKNEAKNEAKHDVKHEPKSEPKHEVKHEAKSEVKEAIVEVKKA